MKVDKLTAKTLDTVYNCLQQQDNQLEGRRVAKVMVEALTEGLASLPLHTKILATWFILTQLCEDWREYNGEDA